jgi:alkylation response protein AidB-like acyl-CoA dehydrogenase
MAGKASFNWEDPLLLDQQLTEDERMVRDTAASYAQDKLAPRVLEAFRNEKTDPAIFREMGEMGLLGTDDSRASTAAPASTTSAMAGRRARSSASIRAIAR